MYGFGWRRESRLEIDYHRCVCVSSINVEEKRVREEGVEVGVGWGWIRYCNFPIGALEAASWGWLRGRPLKLLLETTPYSKLGCRSHLPRSSDLPCLLFNDSNLRPPSVLLRPPFQPLSPFLSLPSPSTWPGPENTPSPRLIWMFASRHCNSTWAFKVWRFRKTCIS